MNIFIIITQSLWFFTITLFQQEFTSLLNYTNSFVEYDYCFSFVSLVTSPIKDMLVGKALGDASVTIGKKGVGFKIEHSIKQEDYVVHQWNIQKEAGFVDHEIRKYMRKNSVSLCFATGLRPEFEEFREFILSMNPIVRGLPKNIEELITPIALSYWIMDDGQAPVITKNGVIRQGATICTDSYTHEQVKIFQGILTNKFGQKVSTHKKNDNQRLYISKASMNDFRNLVLPHLIPSMEYKVRILFQYRGNEQLRC